MKRLIVKIDSKVNSKNWWKKLDKLSDFIHIAIILILGNFRLFLYKIFWLWEIECELFKVLVDLKTPNY